MDQTKILDTQPATTESMPPEIHIPGYKIMRELGHGGMAHVYLAVQESFGREVALKILSPHLTDDEQFSKRFLREARIVSQLNHPNIVTVYDAGKQGKYNYMSMEYISGKDLKQLKDTISRKEALRVVKDVAAALDFAGKKGIVHRDVKPENIMIHQSDNRVILMDFGIAHGDDVTQGMTQTGKAIGTPHFMSPEQTKGLKVDHRSDIYSLGVVLFQLFAGYLPFDADSAVAVGIKHLTSPIPLLPGGLEIFQPIINRCLSKQPQHRYQKAAEIIDALEGISNKQLENINTKETVFKSAGADHTAETQISEVSLSKKRKIPNIVFPSKNKNISDETYTKSQTSNTRRNLLFTLFLCSALWFADKNRIFLIDFYTHEVFPQLIKNYPGIIPESYLKSLAQKGQKNKIGNKNILAKQKYIIANINQENPSIVKDDFPASSTNSTQSNEAKNNSAKKDRLTELENGLNNNPENAVELTSAYKEMILQSKNVPIARQGLKELREWYVKQIGLAFATEDSVLARQYIVQMKQSFPKAAQRKRFIRLEKKVAFLEKINQHFSSAEKYFKSGALIKPINRNALNEINHVLKLAPNNEEAKNFVDKIVNTYINKATKLQQQGNTHNAILMVEEGIAALNDSSVLINKRLQLKESIKHSKNITLLFKQANKYQAAGQLIKPQAYNAYDIYQRILEKEKGDLRAIAGLKSIHQQLAKKLTAEIHKGNLKASEEHLQTAIKRFGKSSLLANVQLKLNDAFEALAPKIETVKLSASTVTNLITKNSAKQAINTTLKLKQTLYVGFNFINFDPKTTWLDATLYNVTKGIIVARKPIVISNQFGEYYFDINLPTDSFAKHKYKLELRLKNKILASKSFVVQK